MLVELLLKVLLAEMIWTVGSAVISEVGRTTESEAASSFHLVDTTSSRGIRDSLHDRSTILSYRVVRLNEFVGLLFRHAKHYISDCRLALLECVSRSFHDLPHFCI